jgi:hypothetical protein
MVPTSGTGRDRERRMESTQSAAAELQAGEAVAGLADLPRLAA